ncbi:type II toxin-antitoxin system HicB family antitoxin [Candidatus Kaiserbacteria bacterium]|nr:type II toxin-antitoxin system HicB family antitoxin [Candidatus Kaiserbacteria bacterium]
MRHKAQQYPALVTKGEDNFYIVQCPLLPGCVTQGKTLDQALANAREVIALCLEEGKSRAIIRALDPQETSFHSVLV